MTEVSRNHLLYNACDGELERRNLNTTLSTNRVRGESISSSHAGRVRSSIGQRLCNPQPLLISVRLAAQMYKQTRRSPPYSLRPGSDQVSSLYAAHSHNIAELIFLSVFVRYVAEDSRTLHSKTRLSYSENHIYEYVLDFSHIPLLSLSTASLVELTDHRIQ